MYIIQINVPKDMLINIIITIITIQYNNNNKNNDNNNDNNVIVYKLSNGNNKLLT